MHMDKGLKNTLLWWLAISFFAIGIVFIRVGDPYQAGLVIGSTLMPFIIGIGLAGLAIYFFSPKPKQPEEPK